METRCKGCLHKDVCKNIDQFSEVVEAMKNLSITAGASKIPVSSLNFIKPFELDCKFYTSTPLTR